MSKRNMHGSDVAVDRAHAEFMFGLERAMQSNGVRKRDLAERLRVSRAAISMFFKGHRTNPTLTRMTRMAYAAGFEIKFSFEPRKETLLDREEQKALDELTRRYPGHTFVFGEGRPMAVSGESETFVPLLIDGHESLMGYQRGIGPRGLPAALSFHVGITKKLPFRPRGDD
jgi:transcriptional regulator with XRE-family HTH domain